jgi:transposase
MSKLFTKPVIGIDVAADYSMVAILAPNGDIYRKPFKVNHDAAGFDYLLNQIKKVEEEYSMKPPLFMESTGIYHLTLFHFLKNNNLEAYVINPLVTNSNKNLGIRKVKNDKLDAISIATLAKFQNIKMSEVFDIATFAIRTLCRDYYNLTDSRSEYKKKLSSDLRIYFPGYHSVFTDTTGDTSIALLTEYSSPTAILNAPKEDILALLKTHSRKGKDWCNNTYDKIIKAAENAVKIGIESSIFITAININLSIIKAFDEQIEALMKLIKSQIECNETPQAFRDNIVLLLSIAGIGFLTAVTILCEIGDPERFKKPKHLVAFFGIDPSVNESGKFKSNRNKMSKRGTRFGRRALYAIALASVRKNRAGNPINSVLYKYRKENLNGKKNKVALGAIMHKIVNYIFAVLRDKKLYEVRDPRIHSQMYLNNSSRKAS